MTLIPDRKPLECHTRAVPNVSGTGIFNEKFTFEINSDDIKKRLCFSVYNYEPALNQIQFQGCLSFGIKNTLKKQKVGNQIDFHIDYYDIVSFLDSWLVLFITRRYWRTKT